MPLSIPEKLFCITCHSSTLLKKAVKIQCLPWIKKKKVLHCYDWPIHFNCHKHHCWIEGAKQKSCKKKRGGEVRGEKGYQMKQKFEHSNETSLEYTALPSYFSCIWTASIQLLNMTHWQALVVEWHTQVLIIAWLRRWIFYCPMNCHIASWAVL